MNIKSLGYRTDLYFPRFGGEVVDRGSYCAVRTVSNPSHYWGNFLLFDRPPAEGDFEPWGRLFAEEIGTPPDTRHINFAWDSVEGETGEVRAFLDAGFELNHSVVLTTNTLLRPVKYNEEVAVRPLKEDWEWESALQNQIATRDDGHGLESYTVYKTRQMAQYRAMTRAGIGKWFGAFLGDRLTADLGVFVREGVGRYQSVGTHPDFRRRGICGALVHQAGNYAQNELGAQTLVMIADEAYHAAKIYETVGFQPTERQASLLWWERETS